METERRRDGDIESWVHSLDREVTTLGRSQSAIVATIEAIEERQVRMEIGVDKLLEREIAPKSNLGILGAVGAIATIVLIFATFLELRLSPSELMLQGLWARNEANVEIRAEDAREDADTRARVLQLENDLGHLDIQHHDTQERLRMNEIGLSATRAALEEGRK